MREKRGARSRSCNCWKGGKEGRGRGVVFRWTASLISHVAEPSASSSRKTPPMCQLIPSSPGIGAERGGWIIIILLPCIFSAGWGMLLASRRAILCSSAAEGMTEGVRVVCVCSRTRTCRLLINVVVAVSARLLRVVLGSCWGEFGGV